MESPVASILQPDRRVLLKLHTARLSRNLQDPALLIASITRAWLFTILTCMWLVACYVGTQTIETSVPGLAPYLKQRRSEMQMFGNRALAWI